jgi:hypothetical protein
MKRLAYNALVVIGVWESFGPGMLMEPVGKRIESAIGSEACRPLFGCAVCMSSVWGLSYWYLGKTLRPLWHVLALAGLVKLIMKVVFPLRSDKGVV